MVRPAELALARARLAAQRTQALTAVLLCAGALLGACTVGPDYVPPKTSLPAGYSEAAGSQATSPSAPPALDAAWWTNFGDPVLNHLIDEAQQTAPDLAEAEARVREARALSGVAGAALYPEVDAGAAYARTHGSANVPIGVPPGGLGPGIDGNLWQAGFDASWEIDVFGGTRRRI